MNDSKRGLGARFVTSAAAVLACTATSIAVGQTQDCALGDRYLALAKDRIEAEDLEDAITLLRQAASVCSRYETQQQLGEMAAGLSDDEYRRIAVDAFVAAYALAETPAAEARTLHRYARLLESAGDPQNAHPLAVSARRLDPRNAEIVALEQRLAEAVRTPTADQLRAGLRSSLYKPLRAARTYTNQEPGGAARPARADGPSVNIRMNFLTGSVELDAETRPNVAALAEALADPMYGQERFLFIGHADRRGDAEMNQRLSVQRAEAIRQLVTTLQPSLAGRIRVEGRGESEPLDMGTDEHAFRVNRRLQVMIDR